MALSRGMNQEASQDTDLGLLDATLMQNLQDRFCDANNVYLVCPVSYTHLTLPTTPYV